MRGPRWVVVALLVLSAVTFAVLGFQAEADSSVTVAVGRSDHERVSTPLLSARRVPRLLVRQQAAHRLQAALAPILGATVEGRCIVISDGDEELVADSPTTPVAVASNQKLLTASAALEAMGDTATLTTRLAAAAAPHDGVIDGDLWFIGGGDPIIDTDTYQSTLHYGRTPHTSLEAIADRLKAAGVSSITGSIRGDDHRYDSMRSVATWPSRLIAQNQAGPISALSVNDARAYPALGPLSRTVRPAADPPAYAAQALTDLLAARGVSVAGPPASGIAPGGLRTVLDVESLPLSGIVSEMLTFSDNNTAESLVKELAVHDAPASKKDAAGSTAEGIKAVRAHLAEQGFDLDGVEIRDGSGLDPAGRVTCRLLDEVLRTDGPHGPIAEGLPVAAKTGTLRDRYRRSPAAGLVRAKTGTLRDVTALSGWIHTTKDADLSFSVVLNLGRSVTAADLRFSERVTEATLSYPDTVDLALLEPRSPSPR